MSFFSVIGNAIVEWLKLFITPVENLEMLWIIIPIWGIWIFSEFFQEKKGTSFGNAISNGATALFVGIDWTRYVIRQLSSNIISMDVVTILKFAISGFLILFGITIILLGVKANPVVRIIGRVRETTYIMLMFSPIIYGVVKLNLHIVAIILIFLPVFYITVEVLDRTLPTPKIFELDEGAESNKGSGIGNDFSQDTFGAGQQPGYDNLSNFPNSQQQQGPSKPQQKNAQRRF